MDMIRTLIGGFVGLLVGMALVAPIAVAVAGAAADGNLSASAQTIVSLVSTIFVVAILMVAVNMI